MADGEVVIVGNDGIEHVFPPGFDPVKASVIVKSAALKTANEKPLASPSTYDEGVQKWWQQHPKTMQIVRGSLDTLPAVGAMVGGAVATPETLGGGTVAGAALGAGAGRGARDLIAEHLGIDSPTTPLSKASRIALDTAITAAMPTAVATAKRVLFEPKATLADVIETFSHPQQTMDNIVQFLRTTKAIPPVVTQSVADQVTPLAEDISGQTLARPTPTRLPYSPVMEQPSAISQMTPLAEGGPSLIVHGAEQFRTPYQIPPQPMPNAAPVKLADGTWGYRSLASGEPLAEGTTANVVTRGGSTFTRTVPKAIDLAADVRAAKMLAESGLSPSQAAMKASEGNPARFAKIMAAFMSGGAK